MTATHALYAQTFEPIPAHSDFGSRDFGNHISASQDRVAIGDFFQGAVYIYRKSNNRWIREQRIPTPFQIGAIDLEGNRLAISDAFVSVGTDIQVGRVLIYEFDTVLGWSQAAEILAPEQANQPRFGLSLDLLGDRMVVGAPRAPATNSSGQPTLPDGRVYVYQRTAGTWTLWQTLSSSDNGLGQRFGFAVAFADANQILASSRFTGAATGGARGYLYAFDQVGGSWTQIQRIYGGAANARFAERFSVSGDMAAALAGSNLFVLRRNAGTWTADATPLSTLQQNFSTDVAIDQNGIAWSETAGTIKYAFRTGVTLGPAVSLPTPAQSSPSVELGASEIIFADLRYSDTNQIQGIVYAASRAAPFDVTKKFRSGNGNVGPAHGSIVSISGDDLLVTAPNDDAQGNRDRGSAKLFKRVAGEWQLQTELTTPTAQANARLGASGELRGDLLALGAPGAVAGAGQVFVFARSQNAWNAVCSLNPLVSGAVSGFGQSLAFDGGLLAIQDQSNTTLSSVVRTWSVTSGGCVERDALNRTLAGGQADFRFGRSIAIENGVLAAIATGALSTQSANVVTFTRGSTWSAETVMSLPTNPAGSTSGENLRNIKLNATRLVVGDFLTAGNFSAFIFIPSFHSYSRTGSSFAAGRTDSLPTSADISSYSILGDGTLWASGRLGDNYEFSLSTAGVATPILLIGTGPLSSSAQSVNVAIAGQAGKTIPSNREFGQVEFFERINGIWGAAQKLPILPERIFADGVEDVP